MRLILNSLIFFQNHKSRLYFSNDEFFPLKFNESFENWRILSMTQVQILKINDLFAKIWLKIKGFVLFQIVFLCKQLYQRNSCFVFLRNFHFVFHSVPFSVPRFSNTQEKVIICEILKFSWRPSRAYPVKWSFACQGGGYPWHGAPFNVSSDGH